MKKKVFVIVFFLITFAVLFSPYIVQFPAVSSSFVLGKDTGELYHALNLMAPFAAVLGAVATFIAFYVQFSANETLQEENHNLQQKNRIDVVTAHFFELLRLHKENVNELMWMEAAGGNELGSSFAEGDGSQERNASLDDIDVSSKNLDDTVDNKPAMNFYGSLVKRQGI